MMYPKSCLSPPAHELFTALMAAGRGDLDHSAVITIEEDLAGIEARTSQ
ncbi:MAG: hypothetical protein H8E35_07065, partial [Ardenticatenia bacterium]|nr:hypothetical protein [Ardenticatenia bacterium]